MTDKVVHLRQGSTPKRSQDSKQIPHGPSVAERKPGYASADRYALGALGFGLLTGASALIAMPSAYLLVSNPIVRAVVYTVPVLIPAMGATCLGVRALQEGRAARSLAAQVNANDDGDAREMLEV